MKYNESNTEETAFECIVLFRFHHIICDGVTFMSNIAPKLFTNKKGEPLQIKILKPTKKNTQTSWYYISD